MNICYLNSTDDNFPPRSLMHSSFKSWNVCLSFSRSEKPVLSFNLPQARIFSPSVIWHGLWNGLATSACRGSDPSFTNVWKSPLQSTSSPRLWTVRQVMSCVASSDLRVIFVFRVRLMVLLLPCRWCEYLLTYHLWWHFHQDHWCINIKVFKCYSFE